MIWRQLRRPTCTEICEHDRRPLGCTATHLLVTVVLGSVALELDGLVLIVLVVRVLGAALRADEDVRRLQVLDALVGHPREGAAHEGDERRHVLLQDRDGVDRPGRLEQGRFSQAADGS